jgi:cytochrome P450
MSTAPSSQINSIPNPRGLPFIGHIPELSRDPLGYFLRNGRAYPQIVRLDLGPRQMLLVSHPEQVKYILQDNNKNFSKGYDTARPVLGNGLVTAEGEEWRRERRLMQPAFNRSSLLELLPIMDSTTRETLDDWQRRTSDGQPLDMAREFMFLTQTIIVRTMFGADLGDRTAEIAEAFATTLEYLNSILLSPFRIDARFPTRLNRRFRAAMQYIDGVIHEFIIDRRQNPVERHDLLAMLMAARDTETGEPMSEIQMHDEIMTIFLAGHETTATLLAWSAYLLALHPEHEAEVAAEFERGLPDEHPQLEQISNLAYTRQVLEESLRLYPPAWIFARTVNEDDEIGGCHVPAGSMITLSPYITQRLEEFWPDPDRFDPARFGESAGLGRPPYAWFPFGGGPRMCIGKSFAMMEAPLILSLMMRRFRLELAPGQQIHPQPVATLRPKPAVWMHFNPR